MTGLAYFTPEDCDFQELKALVARKTVAEEVPNAERIVSQVPIYRVEALAGAVEDARRRAGLMAEWAHVLRDGPGVLVLQQALPDHGVLDAATAIFQDLIAREKAEGAGRGDHFAAAGNNDRIWNSLQKLCFEDPCLFARYFGSPWIDAVAEAWLGPGYQMTAQVNLVRPGGEAQAPHRDYHLGFMSEDVAARFPAHAHAVSPFLTLQGGIAHCDMPVESGPTKLLPHSHLLPSGYLAHRQDGVRRLFEETCVQLPLAKGDALFFNPALLHGAGANHSAGVHRLVNLLQISSPFGRAMESVDREGMCRTLYPALQSLLAGGVFTRAQATAAIAAAAEGYAFPTNLDTDPPLDGLAPESQAALMHRALAEGMTVEGFGAVLAEQAARRMP